MRQPAVLGSFYPSDPSKVRALLDSYFLGAKKITKPQDCIAAISPHAGYVYSGSCAAVSYYAYTQLKTASTVVFIGPNHTGIGTQASVSMEDWLTPIGVAKCDTALAKSIIKNSKICAEDETGHLHEHSIEVQLPFLQFINPAARVVCICMGNPDLKTAQDIGLALHKSIKDTNQVCVIASSDFTHYEKAEVAKKRDMEAVKLIEKLNSAGFDSACEKNSWTICGHGPIACIMEYSKLKGAKAAKMLHYANSGEQTGDYGSVVAYCSIVVPKKAKL